VDGDEPQGEWEWKQPEEERSAGSIESVVRAVKENVNIDEDGYETVRRPSPRTLGQYMSEIFAVEAEGSGESSKEEQSKN
jgi:hypothetical protein